MLESVVKRLRTCTLPEAKPLQLGKRIDLGLADPRQVTAAPSGLADDELERPITVVALESVKSLGRDP